MLTVVQHDQMFPTGEALDKCFERRTRGLLGHTGNTSDARGKQVIFVGLLG